MTLLNLLPDGLLPDMRRRLNDAKARFARGASPLPTVRVPQAELERILDELDNLRQLQRDRDRDARRRDFRVDL